LFFPGGPGGSGVAQALHTGRNLQTIVDADIDPSTAEEGDTSSLYFDIIGFDPRAVNNTTPQFSCFPSLSSQINFELQAEAEGMLGSSPDSLMRNWQRTFALSQSCSEQLLAREDPAGDEALGEHVNTMPVARDMIEITERHAEWREKQGLKQQKEEDKAVGYDSEQKIAARTRWNRGNEKLLYWGRSYGTVLGATFAAAYPDRISRAVLDGVVDLDGYYDGDVESSSITDADIIFDKFFDYCHAAGPEGCPFHVPGGPSEIKSAYQALESQIRNRSVPVAASSTRGPEVITWTDLKTIQRISVYQPLLVFPHLAQSLADLKLGDGSSMAAFKQRNRQLSCLSDECLAAGLWSQQCTGSETNEDTSSQAILCTDATYLTSVSNEEFKAIWDGLAKDSETIGDYWAGLRLTCAGWTPRAQWRLEGRRLTQLSLGSFVPIRIFI
jgi:pimeloyl-ACP methyl ester carboxylesterase